MQRRHFLARSSSAVALALFANASTGRDAAKGAGPAGAAATEGHRNSTEALPKRRRIRVAFMLGEGANVIDTAGPWEVFQDASPSSASMSMSPFELFTVAPTSDILTMTGGLEVKPTYSIHEAPQPHVIVIPAHRATNESRAWLRKAYEGTDVTMSVCTGAFQLARTGLLDGLPATTHHDFWDSFEKEFPKVQLHRGLRFIDNGRIATAGGLTSGIDMALHVVMRYLGADAAARTARYMEYTSEAWRGPTSG